MSCAICTCLRNNPLYILCCLTEAQGPGHSMVRMNHTLLPTYWSPKVLMTNPIPTPPSHIPLIYPFPPSLCPPPHSSSSPSGSAGLASTQSPSISSTSDIIRTEKSWEHSFPMILKWHQGHSGPAAWLANWLVG